MEHCEDKLSQMLRVALQPILSIRASPKLHPLLWHIPNVCVLTLHLYQRCLGFPLEPVLFYFEL